MRYVARTTGSVVVVAAAAAAGSATVASTGVDVFSTADIITQVWAGKGKKETESVERKRSY